MNVKKTAAKLGGIILITIIAGFLVLPPNLQSYVFPAMPELLKNQKFNLGLDLQGGTELEYKIDLSKVPEADRENIVEGVKEVINRRVNNLGVAEPNIYTSILGDEYHIIVELAGIKDINEARKKVGKTIQLEFKEEKDQIDPDEKEKIRLEAQATLEKVLKDPTKFDLNGNEKQQSAPGKIYYQTADQAYFQNDPAAKFKLPDELFKLEKGAVHKELIEITESDPETLTTGLPGYAIYQILEKETAEREIKTPREISVRHLLIAYKAAERAEESITRSEEEAKKLADDLKSRLDKQEDFEKLAKEYSDDASGKENGGLLEQPAVEDGATYVKEFNDGALALKRAGEISPVVKSKFGFHIIKAEKIINEGSIRKETQPRIKIARIFYSTLPDPWKDTGLTGEHFLHADVLFNEAYLPYVSIRFNEEGGKLFQELTKKNVGKRLAIFVGGDLISAPTVEDEIAGGQAQINGSFTLDEAKNLARDLNTGAIPAPIILSGQKNIGASLGEDALNKSLKAGLIGIALVAIFLIAYYRFAGLLAVIALLIYGILLFFSIKIELPYSVSLLISLIVFIVLISRISKSQDSGWEKLISFILACFVLFFLAWLFSTSIVLTLAGIAAVILSIGMAVDANVLIFERIKEELRAGRPMNTAIDLGFERAWTSIRDSNFSTLITAGILLYFGTSIIKGFAFNLITGVLISMFSAIVVTRYLLEISSQAKFCQNHRIFIGLSKKPLHRQVNIIGKRKIWFGFSGLLIAIGLLSGPLFGLNLGMDFTGGSLLEIKFDKKEVKTEDIQKVITETRTELNKNSEIPTTDKEKISAPTVDFGKPSITATPEGSFIIKMKDIEEKTHDVLLQKFSEKIAPANEIRFSTIGPTIGKTLKTRALQALGISLIMIVVYIAFAFRNVPRSVNPWRFGGCAIVALFHDIAIPLGAVVILGITLGVEIDSLFITALLTLIGYSINDTIVVFDRLRENLKYQKHDESFEKVANNSVNQTFGRSINTSLTTVLAILPLFLFGAQSTRYFVFILIIGIIIGTYSSIFIASPLLVELEKKNRKK